MYLLLYCRGLNSNTCSLDGLWFLAVSQLKTYIFVLFYFIVDGL